MANTSDIKYALMNKISERVKKAETIKELYELVNMFVMLCGVEELSYKSINKDD